MARHRRRAPFLVTGLTLVLIGTGAACRSTDHTSAPPSGGAPAPAAITTDLSVPGRASEHVSLAADGSFAAVVWAASNVATVTDIHAAVSHDGGQTFGAPVRVNARPADARVNGEQPPRVALLPRAEGQPPTIVVLWTARGGQGTKLLTARSDDGGRTFTESRTVEGTDTVGNRGWQALVADRAGAVHAVWLDHRRHDADTAGTHQHNHAAAMAQPAAAVDTVAMAQLSDLYFASIDGSVAPRALSAGVCYCCKTALAPGRDGALHVAWRHVYPGNVRDMAFITSRDGGRTFSSPARVSEDGWSIAGCPDDGPSMAVDRQGRVHVVWPTMAEVDGRQVKTLFHAMTEDGQTFSARVRLPTQGMSHHPQAAIGPDGSLVIVWDESTDTGRRIVRARADLSLPGGVVFARDPDMAAVGMYPIAVAAGDRLLTAWTSTAGDTPVVRLESSQ